MMKQHVKDSSLQGSRVSFSDELSLVRRGRPCAVKPVKQDKELVHLSFLFFLRHLLVNGANAAALRISVVGSCYGINGTIRRVRVARRWGRCRQDSFVE